MSPRKSRKKSACFSRITTRTPARASRVQHHPGGSAAGDEHWVVIVESAIVVGVRRPNMITSSSQISARRAPDAPCPEHGLMRPWSAMSGGFWKRPSPARTPAISARSLSDARPKARRRGPAAAILDGRKTTTSSAFWDWPDGRIPFAGALGVLLDGRGRPRAVIETLRVEIMPFGAVDESFAWSYGEGSRAAWWRAYIGAWYRASAARHGADFSDDTSIICEWLAVAKRL